MTDRTPAQLDRFVAEKVMGWTVRNDDFAAGGRVYVNSHGGDEIGLVDYHPTDDPAQALEAMEKWLNGGEHRQCWPIIRSNWVWVRLWDTDTMRHYCDMKKAEAPTLPLAICKALVEAEGGQKCS
jgi:hypothetical protein